MLRNKIQGIEATDPNFPHLSLAERRHKLRVRCYVKVRLDSGAEGVVSDMSMDGLQLRSNTELLNGQEFDLLYQEGEGLGRVRCRAVWVRPGRDVWVAGIVYVESVESMRESWVKHVLEQLGFDESKTFQKREFIRVEASIPCRLLSHGRGKGRIVNLGIGGALVEFAEPFAEEEVLELEMCLWRILPVLKLESRVRQVRQDPETGAYLHGVLFEAPTAADVKLLGNYVIHFINQVS